MAGLTLGRWHRRRPDEFAVDQQPSFGTLGHPATEFDARRRLHFRVTHLSSSPAGNRLYTDTLWDTAFRAP